MKVRIFLFALIIVFGLIGCSSATPTTSVAPTTKIPIPTPQAGKASVSGKMVTTNNKPLANTLVRLAKIYGEGKDAVYVINDSASPGTYTDKEGFFLLTDIEPGSYAVLFTDSDGNYRSINKTAEMILFVDTAANTVSELGQIKVDLSNPSQ